MSVTNYPIYPQSIQTAAVNIVSTGAATPVTLVPTSTNGVKIDFVNLYTTDTSANTVNFFLYNGTTAYPLTFLSVPAYSGSSATVPPVSLFSSTQLPMITWDSKGNKILYLSASWALQVSATSVTAGKTLTVTASYEAF